VTAHGPSSATRAKALLAKAMDRATESTRLHTPINPIRAVPGAINTKAVRRRRALTRAAPSDAEVADLLAQIAADPLCGLPTGPRRRAAAGRAGAQLGNPLDVADIVLVSFLSGLRIGEITALRWQDVTLKPGHGAISGTGTVASVRVRRDSDGRRVPGTGTHRREGTKSPAGIRVVPITDDVVARLTDRAAELGVRPDSLDDAARPVFPSPGKRDPDGKPPMGAWRDPSNVARAIRDSYDRHDWGWASSHTGRRWRATSLLERGFGVRQVAQLLGHDDPKTTWQYARPRGTEALRSGLDVLRT
jgi:integrase